MSVAAAVFTAATFLSASGSHECHNVLAIDFFFNILHYFKNLAIGRDVYVSLHCRLQSSCPPGVSS